MRAIRDFIGANSGPQVQRQHIFYESKEDINTLLRVHPIPGVIDFLDYTPAATGMQIASDSFNPVAAHGRRRSRRVDPGAGVSGMDGWEQIDGPQGGLSTVTSTSRTTSIRPTRPPTETRPRRRPPAAATAPSTAPPVSRPGARSTAPTRRPAARRVCSTGARSTTRRPARPTAPRGSQDDAEPARALRQEPAAGLRAPEGRNADERLARAGFRANARPRMGPTAHRWPYPPATRRPRALTS